LSDLGTEVEAEVKAGGRDYQERSSPQPRAKG
jgi:hypothetical protein